MANKVGDILLLFSCLFLIMLYNSLYFYNIFLVTTTSPLLYDNLLFYNVHGYILSNNNVNFLLFNNYFININDFFNYNLIFFTSTIICFFIILASICKSAQAGFHF